MSSPSTKTLVLSRSDVQQIVQQHGLNAIMDTLIDRLENAITAYNPEQTSIPVRSGFNYREPNLGLVEWMPLYEKGEEVVIKLVGYHPNNPSLFDLPTIVSTLSAYDTTTGHLTGLMDGVLLTALRTGAASAVASKFMANPQSETLGLIGCGSQAVTQLHALSRLFPLTRVLYYDTDAANQRSFEARCSVLNLNIAFEAAPQEQVVREADILCTATSIDPGAGPLFEGIETKPHLHINAVGSDFPGKVEVPLELLEQSFVCPDFLAQALKEGECQRLDSKYIGPELEAVVKQPANFEHVKAQRSVFDSTGWPLEDKVAMDYFMEVARSLGLGREMEIETMTGDALNPYDFVRQATPEMLTEVNR